MSLSELVQHSIPGKIYDANSVMLASQIVESGGEYLDLGIAKDNQDDIYQRLESALFKAGGSNCLFCRR